MPRAEARTRRGHHFLQRDLTRALKALRAAGIEVKVVLRKDGDIVMIPTSGALPEATETNDWDGV
jgi:hypothetical protein